MDHKSENSSIVKKISACDVEALKNCLEENKGDNKGRKYKNKNNWVKTVNKSN